MSRLADAPMLTPEGCRALFGRRLASAWVVLGLILVAGCGITPHRGVELGTLRENARRVEGGGVECPLAFENRLLRPATVAEDAPVLPYRTDGDSAQGVIGPPLPTEDSVKISCAYAIDGLRVDLMVVGVPEGHAVSGMFDRLAFWSDKSSALAFINANADVPVGETRTLPGKNPGAFVRVPAADGDVAMAMLVRRVDPKAELPTADSVATQAGQIADVLTG